MIGGESPILNYVRRIRQIHVRLVGSSITCVCVCGRGGACIYGAGLCRCCTALTCTPPWNAKYRPVKAIPARLNRPTNPLVDAQSPPQQSFYPTFLYFLSPPSLPFTSSRDGKDAGRCSDNVCPSIDTLFSLRMPFLASAFSFRCYVSVG